MSPELLPAFETSFLNRHFIRFDYCDAKGVQTQHVVQPQAMLILPPLWYLVGWDPLREDFRHFRRRHVPFEDDVCPYSELQAQRKMGT
ncbi:helix-turn-helix transcriptional regulator [Cognatiyoonia sp.]|uniref:helix-turn-helix transcriptional regulator n=1 Tax=Cognatiyoonia sp. TaxID=2211652 RepID=UPI003F69D0FA